MIKRTTQTMPEKYFDSCVAYCLDRRLSLWK